jgi:GNAT superfamily N-acetyltransferase
MDTIIREMKEADRAAVVEMMRGFYASPAVSTNGSEEIFTADVDACVGDSPYLSGYVFERGDELLGYAMLAHSFSTEFGRPCVWIEDIFVKEGARGEGIATRFFAFVEERHPGALFRLEVEPDNDRALHVYEKCGYTPLPYLELKK